MTMRSRYLAAILAALILIPSTTALAQDVRVGDMLLPPAALQPAPKGLARPSGAPWVGSYGIQPWSYHTLPILFEASITAAQRLQFLQACDLWSSRLGIVCRPIASPAGYGSYVTVSQGSSGCFATVGSAPGGRWLNLGNGCWYTPSIAHEIGHVLGLQHEHQRADRDAYVSIDWDAIMPGQAGNFTLLTELTGAGAYDYDSLMHYAAYAFSETGSPTINALQPDHEDTMGRALRPSDGDVASLLPFYGPSSPATPRPSWSGITQVVGSSVWFAWRPGTVPATKYVIEASKVDSFDPAYTASIEVGPNTLAASGVLWNGPAYLRVTGIGLDGTVGASETSYVWLVGPAQLYPPLVEGRDVSLFWSGDISPYYVVVRAAPGGAPIALYAVGTRSNFKAYGAPAGTYYVTVMGGSGESNQVVVTVR